MSKRLKLLFLLLEFIRRGKEGRKESQDDMSDFGFPTPVFKLGEKRNVKEF